MSKKTRISILVPVYNEEQAIPFFLDRIDPVIADIRTEFGCDVELIFTDNCSNDKTQALLASGSASRPHMRVFRFSHNVGFQRSIISGYALSTGDACVQIDVDLEDPPELIKEFIRAWQDGYKVVYGIRKARHEGFLMRLSRSALYGIINRFSEGRIPVGAGDFRLVDRRVIDIVCQVNDAEPYLRGLIANLGFSQKGIPFDRDPRVAGTTKFSIYQYASIGVDGVLQSSIKPLTMALWIGVGAFFSSILLATYYIVARLLGAIVQDGFVSLAALGLLQFSILLLMIGINSLYLGRVYRQVFRRPISVVEFSINSGIIACNSSAVFWPGDPSSLKMHSHSQEQSAATLQKSD